MISKTAPPRHPPPRPPKPKTISVNRASALRTQSDTSCIRNTHYPLGKNPFGDDSDEESDAVNKINVSSNGNTNPFACGSPGVDDVISNKDTSTNATIKKSVNFSVEKTDSFYHEESDKNPFITSSPKELEMFHNLDASGNTTTQNFENKVFFEEPYPVHNDVGDNNPFEIDSLPTEAENEADRMSQQSPLHAIEKEMSETQNEIPSSPRKRKAPNPPTLPFASTEAISPSIVKDTFLLPSSALYLSSETINKQCQMSSPVSCRRQSTSCENMHMKGPAPPRPVGEKREIRADGFIKYPKLRKEIEDVNFYITEIDTEVEMIKAKLDIATNDPTKCKKYATKLAKLMRKRQLNVDKHHQLSNRLQEQVLEDRHSDLEFELRNLLSVQEHLRTPEDHKRESELLALLVEIVEERDKLVENMADQRSTAST